LQTASTICCITSSTVRK